ncbi:replication termination factor 2 [Diorhabda sublineata]|uniref:replication termination factor 2 n=1 Tax=Diorhabda sublineata TaxID=1163346 RepID=UPI0024E0D1D2|nr:replication termination factor 2 [Diorhabda sublineata]
MGCDGGTIPRRDELVRVKKKPETKDKDAELAFKWKCCAITQESLQEPIVVCHLGKLYNKTSLIEALLDRRTISESIKHIKNLKDVKDLKLTPNPEFLKQESKKEGSLDDRVTPYICPVLGLEMSGKFRFVAVWSCGCVFSERALKEIGTKNCHKCTKPFEDDDIVVINGNDEDLELMKTRMEKRRQNQKKNKVKKIKQEVPESTNIETITVDNKSVKRNPGPSTIENSSKKLKVQDNLSHSKIGNMISVGKVTKAEELRKIKPDYSVAKDKQVSNVYKSLFTSHQSEKEQDRAHWVTYNPFYN